MVVGYYFVSERASVGLVLIPTYRLRSNFLPEAIFLRGSKVRRLFRHFFRVVSFAVFGGEKGERKRRRKFDVEQC